jgi:DNA-binding transcriptional ArsR family regulator
MRPDPLSSTLAAIADPTRRAILGRLAQGEATVTELAEPFAMTMPAISKHLKVLERAGLIERSRAAQMRPCRIRAAPLKDAADWIDRYRRLWEERFDRLEGYLRELQAQRPVDAPRKQERPRKSDAPAKSPAQSPAKSPAKSSAKSPAKSDAARRRGRRAI